MSVFIGVSQSSILSFLRLDGEKLFLHAGIFLSVGKNETRLSQAKIVESLKISRVSLARRLV